MKIRSLFFLTIIVAFLGMVTACEGLFKDLNKDDIDKDTDNGSDLTKSDYTVSFEANGGSPAPQNQIIKQGGKVTEPAYMTKADLYFNGWYRETTFINLWDFNNDFVTGNITLYAKWAPAINVQGETLVEKLQWLNSNAASNNTYILEVNKDELTGPQNLYFNGKNNISIRLKGIGGVKNIERYGDGGGFSIGNNVTLIFDENIVLKDPVSVVGGGNLILNNGSKIGNVLVSSGGTFTMNGGEISGNSSTNVGGGVYVSGGYRGVGFGTESLSGGGTFTMNGGLISGNTAEFGGGVYVSSGESRFSYGDELSGTFTMNGGEISGNSSTNGGGGVYVSGGTFTMNGGEISGNSSINGGGVCIHTGTNYSHWGGPESGSGGTFTMKGGEIYGNISTNDYGGGVYADDNSSFEKTGGIITGYSSDTENGNVVKNNDIILNNNGHAVYVDHSFDSRFIRRKETTAGQRDNLIYIRNEPNPPIISGAWD